MMKNTKNIKIDLTPREKKILKNKKVRINEVPGLTIEELQSILAISFVRAREIHTQAEFQSIPSIGARFVEDLIFLGYYSLSDLSEKKGSDLLNAFELKKGYWIDACVEDQFRLVAYVAKSRDYTKRWWDFTEERKKFRLKNGYPTNRPKKSWYEVQKLEKELV